MCTGKCDGLPQTCTIHNFSSDELYDFAILRNAWLRKHVSKKLKLKMLHLGRKLRRLQLFEEKAEARLHFSKWPARYRRKFWLCGLCDENVFTYFWSWLFFFSYGCRIMVEVCHMMISQICLVEVSLNCIFCPYYFSLILAGEEILPLCLISLELFTFVQFCRAQNMVWGKHVGSLDLVLKW